MYAAELLYGDYYLVRGVLPAAGVVEFLSRIFFVIPKWNSELKIAEVSGWMLTVVCRPVYNIRLAAWWLLCEYSSWAMYCLLLVWLDPFFFIIEVESGKVAGTGLCWP